MAASAADLRRVLGDTFTHREARQAAISDKRLYRLRDAGEVVALGGGVYRWADAPPADDDLVEIAERVPLATLCLETALARHGLIDAIPSAIDVAVPRGSTRPALRAPVRLHQFDRATFGLGRDLLDVGARRPGHLLRRAFHRRRDPAAPPRGQRHGLASTEALAGPARPQPGAAHRPRRQLPRAEPALRHALEVLL
jgi:hypothetical protein